MLNHLHDTLGVKKFHFRWILHQLIEHLRAERIKKCQDLPPLREAREANKLRNIVMGDESWFTVEFQESAKSTGCREDLPQSVRQ
jgi:hypothetical protein